MSLIFQPAVATAKGKIMLNLATQNKLGVLQGLVVEQPVQLCPLCWGIFEKYGWEPWIRRLKEMPFQKQLERHFLSFAIRNLLPSQLLPDGTELLRHVRIGHRTGDIHCPSGFGGFIEPAFILHGLQRVL